MQEAIHRSDIGKTDVYILFIAACDATAPGVIINGKIESLDPYGYLPAEQYPNLPFYELLCIFHALLVTFWIIICYFYL